MKYFFSIFFLFFCLIKIHAQEKHFVFIQSDAKQPFYVSVNGKLYSSTASGYVIIPKLAEGNYNFTVGFAQNTFPEQTFTCNIQNKDLGFNLKNFNEKGWGLFNLQTLDVTMASGANSNVVANALSQSSPSKTEPAVISFDKKKDVAPAASNSASEATGNTISKIDDAKPTPAKTDTVAIAGDNTAAPTSLPPASTSSGASAAKTEKAADVKKVSEVAGDEGVRLSYVEGSGKTKDTINVIIPASPSQSSTAPTTAAATNLNAGSNIETASKGGAEKSDLKFLDINPGSKKDTVPTVAQTGRILENSNCKDVATEDDYAKLRKKMAAETTDDKMISEAKKYYRNKCFTTSQIKALSTLFLSDEGRLKFFDASFVSVADASQYYTLQSEFIDPVFVNRFKTMLQ